VVAPYPFLFAGTWLFLRRACGAGPAAFGALLFTGCGFNLSHGVHVNMVSVVAHVPWLLWAMDRTYLAADGRVRARGAAGIALLTGSQCLLGHPQAVWFSALIEVAYLARLVAFSKPKSAALSARLHRAGVVAGAMLLGLVIGAAQIVATIHALRQSTRAGVDPSFATQFALSFSQLLHLVEPYLMWGRVLRWNELTGGADEFGIYGGAVALSLAMWWLASLRSARTRGPISETDRLALWAVALGVVGCWLALGSAGGLYTLQMRLPLVGLFRAPARYMLFAHLGLAVAAAVAMARLVHDEPRRRGGLWAPWALAVLSALAALWWMRQPGAVPVNPSRAAIVLGPVLFAAAAALITLAARGGRWAIVPLVVLAAGDQALYGLGGVIGWQDYVTRQQVVDLLRDDTKGHVPIGPLRIARGGNPNVLLVGGYRALEGYAAIEPVRLLDYHTANALRVAGVEYVHADLQRAVHLPDAQPVSNTWFRITRPLERARLITDVRVSHNPALDLQAIAVERTALAARDLALQPGPAGTAVILDEAPGDIHLRTMEPSRQLLVVSEGYDEGWKAIVDNGRVPVERVNGDFIGCVVPAGTHDVTLRFAPVSRRIGTLLSLVGLTAAAALFAVSFAPHRRK